MPPAATPGRDRASHEGRLLRQRHRRDAAVAAAATAVSRRAGGPASCGEAAAHPHDHTQQVQQGAGHGEAGPPATRSVPVAERAGPTRAGGTAVSAGTIGDAGGRRGGTVGDPDHPRRKRQRPRRGAQAGGDLDEQGEAPRAEGGRREGGGRPPTTVAERRATTAPFQATNATPCRRRSQSWVWVGEGSKVCSVPTIGTEPAARFRPCRRREDRRRPLDAPAPAASPPQRPSPKERRRRSGTSAGRPREIGAAAPPRCGDHRRPQRRDRRASPTTIQVATAACLRIAITSRIAPGCRRGLLGRLPRWRRSRGRPQLGTGRAGRELRLATDEGGGPRQPAPTEPGRRPQLRHRRRSPPPGSPSRQTKKARRRRSGADHPRGAAPAGWQRPAARAVVPGRSSRSRADASGPQLRDQGQGVGEGGGDRVAGLGDARGLPGKLTIRVEPRMPATARESIQWRCARGRRRASPRRCPAPRARSRRGSPPG